MLALLLTKAFVVVARALEQLLKVRLTVQLAVHRGKIPNAESLHGQCAVLGEPLGVCCAKSTALALVCIYLIALLASKTPCMKHFPIDNALLHVINTLITFDTHTLSA